MIKDEARFVLCQSFTLMIVIDTVPECALQ